MKIIKDLRVLKAINRRYPYLKFDKDFKYEVGLDSGTNQEYIYKGKKYELKFFSGCFYPFIVEINEDLKNEN